MTKTDQKPQSTDFSGNTVHYSADGLQKVVALIALSLASLLPIAAISVLYSVSTMPIRLGLIAIFTVVFTIC